jgi:hypothetical protein
MPPLGGFFLRGSMTQRQQSAFRLFRAAGYSPKGAAVIVGGDSRESGINLVSGYQDKTDHGSQGIAQWRLSRLAALEQFCTVNHLASGTLAAQVSFQIYELGKDYPILDRRLRDGTEQIEFLAKDLCFQYERPNPAAANLPNRIRQAKTVLQDSQLATSAHGAVVIGAGAFAAGAHHFADAGKMVVAVIISVVLLAVMVALFNRWRQGQSADTDALAAALQQMQASQAAATAAKEAAVVQAAVKVKTIAAEQAALAAAKDAISKATALPPSVAPASPPTE